MLNDPEKITEYVHEAFQQQARPVNGRTKTRKYLPGEVKRDYPWEAGAYSNIDPYTLETKVGQPEYGQFSLVDHMRDPNLYRQQVSKLPNRESAGLDSIPNELLKHLPEAAHMAIHKLFVLMWMTGSRPTAWKESCTVLIYKKGEALHTAVRLHNSLSIVIAIICDAIDALLWAIEVGNNSWFLPIPFHMLPVSFKAPVLGEFASALHVKSSS